MTTAPTGPTPAHAVVTPARNEVENLPRLAASLLAQTARPDRWVIVDNGSSDGTFELASELARENDWIDVLQIQGSEQSARGPLSVRAFLFGFRSLARVPEFVTNVDADVSFTVDYFSTLLGRLALDMRIGIASGVCEEVIRGAWRPVAVTPPHVRGAAQTYRRECLLELLPFRETVGWDNINATRAVINGWSTAEYRDLPYRHHRRTGNRDRSRWHGWMQEGEVAYAMWYRPSYLVARAAFRSLGDPPALGLVHGYVRAALRRAPREEAPHLREFVRSRQRVGRLPRVATARLLSRRSRAAHESHPATQRAQKNDQLSGR